MAEVSKDDGVITALLLRLRTQGAGTSQWGQEGAQLKTFWDTT